MSLHYLYEHLRAKPAARIQWKKIMIRLSEDTREALHGTTRTTRGNVEKEKRRMKAAEYQELRL